MTTMYDDELELDWEFPNDPETPVSLVRTQSNSAPRTLGQLVQQNSGNAASSVAAGVGNLVNQTNLQPVVPQANNGVGGWDIGVSARDLREPAFGEGDDKTEEDGVRVRRRGSIPVQAEENRAVEENHAVEQQIRVASATADLSNLPPAPPPDDMHAGSAGSGIANEKGSDLCNRDVLISGESNKVKEKHNSSTNEDKGKGEKRMRAPPSPLENIGAIPETLTPEKTGEINRAAFDALNRENGAGASRAEETATTLDQKEVNACPPDHKPETAAVQNQAAVPDGSARKRPKPPPCEHGVRKDSCFTCKPEFFCIDPEHSPDNTANTDKHKPRRRQTWKKCQGSMFCHNQDHARKRKLEGKPETPVNKKNCTHCKDEIAARGGKRVHCELEAHKHFRFGKGIGACLSRDDCPGCQSGEVIPSQP